MAKSSSSSSSSSSTISATTLTGLGNLIKLLPTGTVFVYQFLNPVLTNNGSCSSTNKVFTSILIGLCGLSCVVSSFTDSYKGSDGSVHYGIVTVSGIWPSSKSSSANSSSRKLKITDFLHAFFSVIVFAALSLLDSNTVKCFYPSFEDTKEALLKALPPVIGAISGAIFMAFPSTRNGIGYPSSSDSSSSNSDNA